MLFRQPFHVASLRAFPRPCISKGRLPISATMDPDDLQLDQPIDAAGDGDTTPHAPPSKRARGRSTGTAGKYVSIEGKRFCKAHGMYHLVEEFGPKDNMCREGKQAYEGAMTQAKAQGEVKFLKQLVSGRPEDFQLFIARFQVESPRLGRGRVLFNMAKFRTYIESRSGMGVRWKARFMDRQQYFVWAKTAEGGSKTSQQAIEQWQVWERTSDRSVIKDKNGPNGSMRVAVHIEDVVYGYSEVTTGQQASQEKDIKNATGEQIEELKKQAVSGDMGVHGFDSDVFSGAGGAMGAALAQRQGPFSSGLTGAFPANSASNVTDMASLLKDFGYTPAEKKGRGRQGATKASPVGMAEGSKAEGSKAEDALASNKNPQSPDAQHEGSLASVPLSDKKLKDLPSLRLKAKDTTSKKLEQVTSDAKTNMHAAETTLQGHAKMHPDDMKVVDAWRAITDVRHRLVQTLVSGTPQDLESFWNKCNEEEQNFLNISKGSLRCVHAIQLQIDELLKIEGADLVDERKTSILDDISLMHEASKLLKKSVSDYAAAVKSQARARERRDREEMSAQAKQASAHQALGGGAARGARARQSAAQGGRPVVTAGPPIFNTIYPASARTPVYDDLESFSAALKEGKVDMDVPYIVKNFDMTSITAATKAQEEEFVKDFPVSIVFKGTNPSYRGQSFLKHTDDALVTAFKQHAPGGIDIESSSAEVTKHLSMPAIFGRGPSVQWCGGDFKGVGSIRIFTDGMVKITTIDIKEIVSVLNKDGSHLKTMDELQERMHKLSAEQLQDMCRGKTSLRSAIVAAGCVLYIPAGVVVAEKSLRNEFIFGIRLSLVVPTEQAAKSLSSFVEIAGSCETKQAVMDALQKKMSRRRTTGDASDNVADDDAGAGLERQGATSCEHDT